MKSKKTMFFIGLILTLLSPAIASDFDYDWSADPLIYDCPDSLKSFPEVVLLKKNIAYYYNNINNAFMQRYYTHQVIYLSSDEAIEQNNKIYLPIEVGETLETTKARVITPNRKVIELDTNDINSQFDEAGNTIRYFALKGLEIGSVIEFLFVYSFPANYTGSRLIMQDDIPQLNVSFDLIAPSHLRFDYVGKNGFEVMEVDSTDEELLKLHRYFEYVPPFKAENEAFTKPNLTQVIYKLGENTISGRSGIISYDQLAQGMIQNYATGSNKDSKRVLKWIKEAGISDVESNEVKLRTFEVWLKKNIAVFDANESELADIEFIEKNKVCSATGFIKIMALACTHWAIKFEIVLTCDRSDLTFDSSFEAYNYLQDFLMYFPNLGLYMDPNSPFGVMGIAPVNLQDTYGVFFQPIQLTKGMGGISRIDFLAGAEAEKSHHDMIMKVSINETFDSLNVDLMTKSTGYFAAGLQPYYDLLDPEEIETFNKDQVTWIDENIDVIDVTAENTGFDQLGQSPFIINSTYRSGDLMVKARDKYLIKIGLLIGPQVEMYQENKRQLPVDMGYRKVFDREIRFVIPEGYKVSNAEALILENTAEDNDGVYAGFHSSFEQKNDELIIRVNEYYHKVHYEVEAFEDYRKVINSAADFNKIVLFLEKS